MKKVLYIVEPMIGIGPNVDANLIAKNVIKSFPNIELVIYMDDQVPLAYTNDRVRWCRSKSWRYDSINEQIKDLHGNLLSEEFKNSRRDEILKLYKDFKPDVLLLHNYISGSKWDEIIDFEILPLIELARKTNPEIKIYSFLIGMIDSFENMTSEEEIYFINSVKQNIDRIFLRSDSPELFFKTCPAAKQFSELFIPVGYSGEFEIPPEMRRFKDNKEVIVSTGGGDLGYDLFKTSIEAYYLAQESKSELANYNWRLFVGPLQQKNKQQLLDLNLEFKKSRNSNSETQLMIEDHVSPDEFLSVLCHNCVLSISQCGQRTFTELELAGVPSVVVPRESNGKEFEQLYRADYMKEAQRALSLRERDLNSVNLLKASEDSIRLGGSRLGIRMGGVQNLLTFVGTCQTRLSDISYSTILGGHLQSNNYYLLDNV